MTQNLVKTLRSLVSIPETEVTHLLKILQHTMVTKGSYFIREGQIPRKFAFVDEGLFHCLYTDEKGNEFTKSLVTDGQLLASYSAMIAQEPSKMLVEAIEDSSIFEINYAHWIELQKRHECWKNLIIALLEKELRTKDQLDAELYLLEPAERYLHFQTTRPDLEQRLKQQQVASYLGVTAILLSKMRGKKR